MNKKTLTIAAAILTIAGSTAAFAAELPTYEANGFPVSPLQVRVLGAAHVAQQAAAPTTVASVHQTNVISPRKLTTANVTTGAAR
ncbi:MULTISPECIES: hypothetical protein [unclassified Bradyrhizobium]|uniref:hypothetical protein n=1 Tax=unclassified Bradyrhizobium TaxID=2631580 RepID=UPI00211F36C4|nr:MULTISPECIES: hypothetical protein [unclassified Bradyrhizobium]MDD1535920.1 hypothetical protein [Bradyrhizobium sp. WBOS8]MDD1585405.1 hypothetical protein [Bradyrhizobium sp. WBOS4]UUO48660.1 hypothetical protein DCM78_18175 [Bradyrhizobium sp. WBOS04]UUO62480.1 hypothetical protein DCM80_27045 [Bradyrhizobium sp. WBOS08]